MNNNIIVYNPITNEIGITRTVNNMLLIDFGYGNIYKAYTNVWVKLGEL